MEVAEGNGLKQNLTKAKIIQTNLDTARRSSRIAASPSAAVAQQQQKVGKNVWMNPGDEPLFFAASYKIVSAKPTEGTGRFHSNKQKQETLSINCHCYF